MGRIRVKQWKEERNGMGYSTVMGTTHLGLFRGMERLIPTAGFAWKCEKGCGGCSFRLRPPFEIRVKQNLHFPERQQW